MIGRLLRLRCNSGYVYARVMPPSVSTPPTRNLVMIRDRAFVLRLLRQLEASEGRHAPDTQHEEDTMLEVALEVDSGFCRSHDRTRELQRECAALRVQRAFRAHRRSTRAWIIARAYIAHAWAPPNGRLYRRLLRKHSVVPTS